MLSFLILHLDDDPLELRKFSRTFYQDVKQLPKTCTELSHINFTVQSCQSSSDLLHYANKCESIQCFVLDINLSSQESCNGFSLIKKVKLLHPNAAVIMSSYQDDASSIIKALSLTADDFISKLVSTPNLPQHFYLIYKNVLLKNGVWDIVLNATDTVQPQSQKYVGRTMQSLSKRIPKIISSALKCILIEGESGTGKEVVADIFEESLSQHTPFIRVNCAAFPPNLIESELFGYKKGAFTGALQDKKGLLESADGGFLFLDEIASLSLNAQAMLLRAIENQEIIRIGEVQSRKINVRYLCASNLSLQNLVEEKSFRNDLLQRLSELELKLLPLSHRKDEIPELIDFFCKNMGTSEYFIDPLAKKVLAAFHWKNGNIRELRNVLKAMTEFAENNVLGVWGIPSKIFEASAMESSRNLGFHYSICKENGNPKTYQELCDEILKTILNEEHKTTGKINVSHVAQKLDISRTTLINKIKLFNFFV